MLLVLSVAGLCRAMGRNQQVGAIELCEVSDATKLGEGYSIAGTEM